MLSGRTFGIVMVATASVAVNVYLLMDKMIVAAGLPHYRVLGFAELLSSSAWLTLSIKMKVMLPKAHEWKWVLPRGLISVVVSVSLLLASQMGTPLGDIGALISVNSVFAALLGRIFLQEPVHARHFLAIILSMVGATLISKPSFVFGSQNNSNSVGGLFALASGIGMACIFVISRKAAKIPTSLLCVSVGLQNGLVLLFLPDTFFISDLPFVTISTKPMEFSGWLCAVAAITAMQAATSSTGYKYCPAALSAAVDTATKMVSGYAMDTIIFNMQPEPLTLIGAFLMLSSVVIATAVNPEQSSNLFSMSPQIDVVNVAFDVVQPSDVVDDDQSAADMAPEEDIEVESLSSFASFAASEFTGCSPALRQRGSSGKSQHIVEQHHVLPHAVVSAVRLGV
eukprot:gnl/MRDRNA2_/MRDRNA2_86332_c0_seq3.p1 gnl/MRDRNA2_/MRDRNA2_86332_c0~~gnl/MRDRNA2_/MRDRNA2_86332_c0_seq3.p1  ORF type:complete len:397 (-),score=54.51 gnl/MRDRNA2_/MRDRNA2_86332_c0_seq3:261-1451(-)